MLLVPLLVALADVSSQPLNTCGDDFPKIVIGCWQILERHADHDTAVSTLQKYSEAGFTTFDTADIYGESEGVLGKLRASGVDASIHTKYVTSSPQLDEARRVNAKSRDALGAVPDLVAFHWWDFNDKRFVEAAQHLVELGGEEKLHKVAACNFDTAHLRQMVDAGVPIVSNQVQYSLLDRRPENGMLHYAKTNGIRLATFGTVAGGWLSDRWLGAPPPSDRAANTVSLRMYRKFLDRWCQGDWELFQELLQVLRDVADKHTTTIANIASAWVLYQLGDTGGWVILGVRDTRHLDEHKALLHVAIDATDDKSIQEVLHKGRFPRGDIWSHERGLA